MNGFKKFKNFIKSPGRLVWVFWAALAASGAASILLAVFYRAADPVSYFFYALTLTLLIYCVCVSARPFKAAVSKRLHSHPMTDRLLRDYGYRTVMFSLVSLVVGAVYAAVLAVLGAVFSSAWYGFFAGYYLVLIAMRVSVVFGAHRINVRRSGERTEGAALKLCFCCGAMFPVLSVAFCSLAGILVFSRRAAAFGLYGAIMMAVYAFWKLIASVVNAVRAKKSRDPVLQSLRGIGFADAAVSLFSLEIAMTATFGGEERGMFALHVATGGAVFLLTLGVGIYLMAGSALRLKKLRADGQVTDCAGAAGGGTEE